MKQMMLAKMFTNFSIVLYLIIYRHPWCQLGLESCILLIL